MRGLPAHAILFTVRLKQRANKPQKIQMTIESSLKASIARWFPGATGIDRWPQLSVAPARRPGRSTSCTLKKTSPSFCAARHRAMAPAPGRAAGLEAEAVLMQQAYEAGIPSPRVRYVLRAEDNLGSGFIMDRVEGETIRARFCAMRSLPTRARCWRASLARWLRVFTRWTNRVCRNYG